MRIDNIIQTKNTREEISILAERCLDFIKESNGIPLLKNLPKNYGDFHKVKVRKRKQRKEDSKEFAVIFNKTFENFTPNLRERAIFAYTKNSLIESTDSNQDTYYIFPIDGYYFMYSKEVENSSVNYKKAFDAILEQLGTNEGENIISELLKFNYITENLEDGMHSGSEIIIYNIPYFYAIRKNTIDNYQELIDEIQGIK